MHQTRGDPAVTGLLMAGGSGRRMQLSGVKVPKPLVMVGGITLLERNLRAFVRAGVEHVTVSVSRAIPEVVRHVTSRLSSVAQAAGITLNVIEEFEALGNVGAVRLLPPSQRSVIVTFADNVTTLDLRRVADFHSEAGAALTLAVHYEPIQMPYGELALDGDSVIKYHEKPVRELLISSGVSVMSPDAIAAIPRAQPTALGDLHGLMLTNKERVRVQTSGAVGGRERCFGAHPSRGTGGRAPGPARSVGRREHRDGYRCTCGPPRTSALTSHFRRHMDVATVLRNTCGRPSGRARLCRGSQPCGADDYQIRTCLVHVM